MGVNGARRVAETHSFSSPDRGMADPESIAYPLDLKCGTPRQHGAKIEAWIYDEAEAGSPRGDPSRLPSLTRQPVAT
jgi:hypothetical protein